MASLFGKTAIPDVESPKVSIIIPFYNEEKNIENAIKSAQQQTLKEIEIICVDDGSIDTSPAIVRKIMRADKRVKLLELGENKGLVFGRWKGAQMARAPYIEFLDADDKFYIEEITTMALELAEKHKADVIHYKENRMYWKDDRWNMEIYEWANPALFGLHSGREVLEQHYLQGANGSTMHGKLLLRETYLQAMDLVGNETLNAGIFYNEDMLQMGAVYLLSKRYVGMNKTGYNYYYHNTNSMQVSKTNMLQAERRQNHSIAVYQRLMDLFPTDYQDFLRVNYAKSVAYHIVIASKFMKYYETATLCDRYLEADLMLPQHAQQINETYCVPAHQGSPYQVSDKWKQKQAENERKWKQIEAEEQAYQARRKKTKNEA